MPGLNDRPASEPVEPTPTPLALAELAASTRDARPSAAVARALDEAWQALHEPRPSRQRPPAWTWGLAAAGLAAAVLVALGGGWLRPGVPPGAPEVVISADGTGAVAGPDDQVTPGEPVRVRAVPDGPVGPPPPRPSAPSVPPRPQPAPTPAAPDGGAAAPGTRPRPPVGRSESGSGRVTPRLARADGPVDTDGAGEPFVWLRGADAIEPGLGMQIVRVQVPRLRWETGTPERVLVEADLLMGLDGQPRAVRMVRTGASR